MNSYLPADGKAATPASNSSSAAAETQLLEQFYYIASDGTFYDTTKNTFDRDARRSRQYIVDKFGTKAPSELLDRGNEVSNLRYNPSCADQIFTANGHRYLNTFKFSTVTQPAAQLNLEHPAIQVYNRHLDLLFKPQDRTVIHQWIAFNYQRIIKHQPNTLIRWAPLINSVPGTGKGKLFDLITALLGKPNTVTIQNTQLKDKWTKGWIDDSAVTLFNEVHVTGNKATRDSVMNALKVLISDDEASSEGKGQDAVAVKRTANVIAFTNHYDSITIDANDRRWAVIDAQTPCYLSQQDRDQHLDAITAIPEDPESLQQIGAYLMGTDLSQFNKNHKPETSGTDRQVYDSVSEYAQQVREIIEQGAYGISGTFALIPCLQHEARKQLRTSSANNISKALIELGYTRHQLWTGQVRVYHPEVKDTNMSVRTVYLKDYPHNIISKPEYVQKLGETTPKF
ncbi:MAG: hypothetical protein HWE12_03640 [Oceanospirillaceae bacterium]|nr:hypothetical protein [Oceanospirillaceae bacterium]